MADKIRLTEHFAIVQADPDGQPYWCALDVSAYDVVELHAVATNLGAALSLTIRTYPWIVSATWAPAGTGSVPTFTLTSSSPSAMVTLTGTYSRYLRWTSTGGVGARFCIYGLGHKYGASVVVPAQIEAEPASTTTPSMYRPLRPNRWANKLPHPSMRGSGGSRQNPTLGPPPHFGPQGQPSGSGSGTRGSGGLHLPTSGGPWRGPRAPKWRRK